jgi:hypothetical protein
VDLRSLVAGQPGKALRRPENATGGRYGEDGAEEAAFLAQRSLKCGRRNDEPVGSLCTAESGFFERSSAESQFPDRDQTLKYDRGRKSMLNRIRPVSIALDRLREPPDSLANWGGVSTHYYLHSLLLFNSCRRDGQRHHDT